MARSADLKVLLLTAATAAVAMQCLLIDCSRMRNARRARMAGVWLEYAPASPRR